MRISFLGPLLPSARHEAGVQRGLVYRLRHWPELPEALHTVHVLRALSVMSNRPVNREWILRHSRLRPQALDELLQLLAARGDVEVVDTSGYARERG